MPALVWLITARSVAPGAWDLLLLGRPSPGTPRPLSLEARMLGVLLAVSLVLICVRAVLHRRGQRSGHGAAGLAALWMAYLALEFVSCYLNDFQPLLSVGSGLLVLLALARSGSLAPGTVVLVTRPLLAIVYFSLALAVVAPRVAKFGDPYASWLSRDARLAGVLDQPNQMGLLAGFTIVLVAAHARSGRWRGLHLVAAGVALLLSASYTSWVATTVALLVLWAGQARGTHAALPVGLAGAGVALAVYHVLSERFVTEGSLHTVSGRRVVWDFVARQWPERELFGHGSGVWSRLVNGSVVEPWAVHAHNQVLNTLYVGGVVGLGILVAALGATAAFAAARWRRGSALPLALVALQVVRSYTEVPFELVFGGLNLLCLVLVLVAVAVDPAEARRSTDA